MSILNRYILRAHFGPFIFGVATVMFLFLFQFLMKYLDELLGKGLSNWIIFQLIGLNLAWMFVLAVPMGVLFSTLMAFGSMGANQEVTVIKASGGGLIKMMTPVLIFSFFLTVFLFWFNDQILPEANHQAKILLNDITRKKPTFSLEAGQFSTQLEGYTILARGIDSVSGTLRSVTVYDNAHGRKSSVISADSGTVRFSGDYTRLIMDLFSGEIHQYYPNSPKDYNRINFKKYQFITSASGFNFERSNEKQISRGDRELKISDMQKIVNDAEAGVNESKTRTWNQLNKHYKFLAGIRDKGDTAVQEINPLLASNALRTAEQRIELLRSLTAADITQQTDLKDKANEYRVEIYKKYSIPFACLIFVLVGCPLGIMTRGGNFGISAAISLGFYIIYWAFLIGGEKLADRAYISPIIAMWAGNVFIGIIGLILVLKVNNESLSFPFGRFLKKIFQKKDSIKKSV